MDGTVILVLLLIWVALTVVLLYKVWGISQDLKVLKEWVLNNKMAPDNGGITAQQPQTASESKKATAENRQSQGLKLGDKVRHEVYYSGRTMIVDSVNSDGTYTCTDEDGNVYGNYPADKLTKV